MKTFFFFIYTRNMFWFSFDVNICRKAEVEELFLFIAAKNGTDMKAPRKEKVRMGFSSNRFNCGRRIRDRRSAKDDNEEIWAG